ncbi:hypothetical protein LCGC14_1079940 [marine sediment metagenome]|uniref:Uncharacterized protein n=1 Tax=marine sediment metagenome TaxID=412755 RepID=A0A0F9N374_9ZZZZ
MTSTYPSIEAALVMGIYFSGRAEDLKAKDLEGKPGEIQGALGAISPEMANLFDAADINEPDTRDGKYNAMIYDIEVKGKDGIPHKAQLGVTTFRNGYNLWIIDVESGMCIRT